MFNFYSTELQCAAQCLSQTGKYGKCTTTQNDGDKCLLGNSVPNCSPGAGDIQPSDQTALVKQTKGPSPLRGICKPNA